MGGKYAGVSRERLFVCSHRILRSASALSLAWNPTCISGLSVTLLCARRDSGCCVLRPAGSCDASSLRAQTRPVATKRSPYDGYAGVVALIIGLWVFPFESLSFSLRESFEGLSL
jgi:hypothetical protein